MDDDDEEQRQGLSVYSTYSSFVYVTPGLPLDSKERPPEAVLTNIANWKALHPSWDIFLWNNTFVNEPFPELIQVGSKLATMAWVADLVRYRVIEKFGGVYLDTDIEPNQSLEPLLSLGSFTVCEVPDVPLLNQTHTSLFMEPGTCNRACNAVIGATKGHPALSLAALMSMSNTRERLKNNEMKYNVAISGPFVWTDAIKRFPSFHILYSFTFYPCMWIPTGMVNARRNPTT